MAELPEFQRKQYAFAAHIRDPENNPAPAGIEDRRMAVYRELFFNNLLKLLSGTFPVLRKLHTRSRWRGMIRAFMVSHHAQTPYFLKIPEEFLAFLETGYQPDDEDFPFLLELAHYEWAELALSVSEASNADLAVDEETDFLAGIPVKSRLAWSLAYRFPVHRINESFQPGTADATEPTFLVMYRAPDDELGFMELNPVTAKLLETIETNTDRNGRELLSALAKEINYPDVDAMIQHGLAAMRDMHDKHILLGSKTR